LLNYRLWYGDFDNPETVREAYRRSTENLKFYMQRQWSLVGGMAGTFREMEKNDNMKGKGQLQ